MPKLGQIASRVLFENDRVRVWDLTVEPGQATDWHQHELDYLFVVIEKGKVHTEYANGATEPQDDELGHTEMRTDREVHRLVNDGPTRYRDIVIELK